MLTAREGNNGNCHPEKTNIDRGEVEVDIDFRGVTIIHVTLSCSKKLLYYIECFCKLIHRLHQNNPGYVNVSVWF